MNTIVTQSPQVIKTQAENEAAFAEIQELAAQTLADFRAKHPGWTLSYEDTLQVYMQTWTEAGYDSSGMWPTDSFDEWVEAHEVDFDEVIRRMAVRANPALRGQNLRINGTLGVNGDGPSSCACFYVCDGNGENCTECICDPEGCSDCE